MSKFDAVGFFSNMVAVILGIVITFSIQGIIDAHNQKENLSSALGLVKEELIGCKRDLESCSEFIEQERIATSYLQTNLDHLHSCPKDTVARYGLVYITEMLLTLPNDALELLKTSSLFSVLNDNHLSLAIIRAYDQCNAMRQVFNRHETLKTEILKPVFVEKGIDKCFNPDGTVSISALMKTKNGMYLTMQLLGSEDRIIIEGLKDVDEAVALIDEYLAR